MLRLLLPGATAPQPNKSVSAAVAFQHTIPGQASDDSVCVCVCVAAKT